MTNALAKVVDHLNVVRSLYKDEPTSSPESNEALALRLKNHMVRKTRTSVSIASKEGGRVHLLLKDGSWVYDPGAGGTKEEAALLLSLI